MLAKRTWRLELIKALIQLWQNVHGSTFSLVFLVIQISFEKRFREIFSDFFFCKSLSCLTILSLFILLKFTKLVSDHVLLIEIEKTFLIGKPTVSSSLKHFVRNKYQNIKCTKTISLHHQNCSSLHRGIQLFVSYLPLVYHLQSLYIRRVRRIWRVGSIA